MEFFVCPGVDAWRETLTAQGRWLDVCYERLVRQPVEVIQELSSEAGKPIVVWFYGPQVDEAAARLEPLLGPRLLVVDIPDDLPLVAADPVLLEQVFVNLIENAVRHAPGSAPIELTARPDALGVTVTVADRGPGLPPGGEARVFEKFYRAGAAARAGAGLGLAICRGIVEAHGGRITAGNRPDGGAVFTIELPVPGDAPRVPLDGLEEA